MPLPFDEPRTRAWLALLRAPDTGPAGIRDALQRHGHVERVPSPPFDAALLAADLEWLRAPDHHLITCDSDDFPALLARIPQPPAALFVAGDPNLLWQPQIALVGSRNPSAGGRDNAVDFARELARNGLTITSGLADGIDTAAHRAALDAGLPTVAVLGTGADRVYPARNRALAQEIAARGALVSEYPLGTPAQRDHFPRRNRIIAGLALGTLVVEASLQSGSLITARLAAEAGREVFALPGSIHNPMARGCHRLIRDGALLVETAREIVETLASQAAQLGAALRERLRAPADAGTDEPVAATDFGADPDYAKLWRALDHDPVPLDELVRRSGLTVAALSSMLLLMELEGHVSAAHGRYAKRRS
jgi:DNA processing protein